MEKFYWANVDRTAKNQTVSLEYVLESSGGGEILRICASNSFKAYENDKLIAYGPMRTAPGYAAVISKPLTQSGRKKIKIEIAGYNVYNFYQAKELPYVCVEILQNGTLLASTENFVCFIEKKRIAKVPRYSYQRTFAEVYDLYNERQPVGLAEVDGPKIIGERDDCCNYGYLKAKALPSETENKLRYDTLRFWWEDQPKSKLDDFTEVDCDPKTELYDLLNSGKSHRVLYDFSRCVTGFLTIKIKCRNPASVYVCFDEVLTEGDISLTRYNCNNVVKWKILGDCVLQTFEPYEMRYLKIVSDEEFSAEEVGMILYQNDEVYQPDWKIEDKELDLIFQSARHTLAQNSADILMDCPGRERAGWLCDSFFSGQAEYFFTGKNRVEKYFLENYLYCDGLEGLPEGMVPMCFPADSGRDTFIPNWAMFYVLELSGYYKRTADRPLIERSREKVYGIVRYFQKFENELCLLENLEGWIFVEWSACNQPSHTCGVNVPSNMLYYKMLLEAGKLYDDKNLLKKAEEIGNRLKETAFDGTFYVENLVRSEQGLKRTENYTETCQYYAMFCGLAEDSLIDCMLKNFGADRPSDRFAKVSKSNAFIGNFLRLYYLAENKLYQKLLAESKEYFLYMAKETQTLWENDTKTASCNHGFASIVAKWIAESLGQA